MFADVEDGPGVTETEYATLRFVAEGGRDGKEYHLDPSASKYLVGKLREHDPASRVRPARSPRLYRTHRGVRYDENALTIAEAAVKHRGRVSKEDAEAIWADVHDHGEVTDTEYRTLARVCGGSFKITAAAKRFLWEKVPGVRKGGSQTHASRRRRRRHGRGRRRGELYPRENQHARARRRP